MKKALIVIGVILLAVIIYVAIDFARDVRTVKGVIDNFKPELVPIKLMEELSEDEKTTYDACLTKKVAATVEAQNEDPFCRCYAVGSVKYVFPLMPKDEDSASAKTARILDKAGEMGAMGMVIMQDCAKLTTSEP